MQNSQTDPSIFWTPLDGGKVKQEWPTSSDRGRTWQTSFVGIYAKGIVISQPAMPEPAAGFFVSPPRVYLSCYRG